MGAAALVVQEVPPRLAIPVVFVGIPVVFILVLYRFIVILQVIIVVPGIYIAIGHVYIAINPVPKGFEGGGRVSKELLIGISEEPRTHGRSPFDAE